MIVKIKMKDTTSPIYFEGVISHFLEGETLGLLFEDNTIRNFPLMHIFYYETKQDRVRVKTTSEISND